MQRSFEHKRYGGKTAVFSVVFLLCFIMAFSSVVLADVAVRAGAHNGFSRLVFDWRKIARYQVSQNGDQLDIIFERDGAPSFSGINFSRYPEIDGAEVLPAQNGQTHVRLDLADDVTFKHSRLVRKIVFDFRQDKTASVTSSATEPALQNTLDQKTDEQVNASVDTPVQTPQALKPAEEKGQVVVDKAPVEAVEQATLPEEEIDPQRTVLSISTLEPTNLAVFDRVGYLWLVLDNDLSNIPPEKFGPMSGFLGQAERLDVEGDGVAYRYPLPAGVSVVVNKEGLSWQVILSRGASTPIYSNAHVFPDFSRTNEARLISILPPEGGNIVKIQDPVVGDYLWVVPVDTAGLKVDQVYETSDLEITPAHLGMVVRPKRDDLRVNRYEKRVVMSAPGGLHVTSGVSTVAQSPEHSDQGRGDTYRQRIFDFPNWKQGGVRSLLDNKRLLERQLLSVENPVDRSQVFLRLALLHFSNNMAHEALGLLRMASSENPDMLERPSFRAIRGATRALAGQYQGAIEDLSIPSLKNQPEAKLWRGYAAAATEQWLLASKDFPEDNRLLAGYPSTISIPFTIYMAEAALRVGNRNRALELLDTLEVYADDLLPRHRSAIAYLKGESFRQADEKEKALLMWQPVFDGRDRLYHAKAGLALTVLMSQEERIDAAAALDRLENLRYAWRGDGLEVGILHKIGQFRIRNGLYKDGLQQLRRAVELAQGRLEDSEPITQTMVQTFKDLYVNDKAEEVAPLEAVSIFNDFRELMPVGKEGTIASENFADYLVEMDLLDRALNVLEDRVIDNDGTIVGARVGTRMASVYLLDNAPQKALDILQRTEMDDMPDALIQERDLMRARAFSQLNKPKAAIAALSSQHTEDAQRLRADIHWRAGHWAEAARALNVLLPTPAEVAEAKSLNASQAQMMLNTAVAFRLSGEDANLMRLKDRYGVYMNQSDLAPSFAVVTRISDGGGAGDRKTMLDLASEVDIFESFLDSYRAHSG